MVVVMKPPIFVRSLLQEEREALTAGLRSKDAFVLRRSQILLASSPGESPPRIAQSLGCGSQTVRNAIHDFNERGLDVLSRPAPRAQSAPAPPSMSRAPSGYARCSTALREGLAGTLASGR